MNPFDSVSPFGGFFSNKNKSLSKDDKDVKAETNDSPIGFFGNFFVRSYLYISLLLLYF